MQGLSRTPSDQMNAAPPLAFNPAALAEMRRRQAIARDIQLGLPVVKIPSVFAPAPAPRTLPPTLSARQKARRKARAFFGRKKIKPMVEPIVLQDTAALERVIIPPVAPVEPQKIFGLTYPQAGLAAAGVGALIWFGTRKRKK